MTTRFEALLRELDACGLSGEIRTAMARGESVTEEMLESVLGTLRATALAEHFPGVDFESPPSVGARIGRSVKRGGW